MFIPALGLVVAMMVPLFLMSNIFMFGNPCGKQIMSLALDAAVSGADASSSFAMEVASLELPLVDTVSLFAMVVDAAEAFCCRAH